MQITVKVTIGLKKKTITLIAVIQFRVLIEANV